MNSNCISNLHLGQKSAWTNVSLDKSLLCYFMLFLYFILRKFLGEHKVWYAYYCNFCFVFKNLPFFVFLFIKKTMKYEARQALTFILNPISPGVLDPGNTPGSRLLFDLETLYIWVWTTRPKLGVFQHFQNTTFFVASLLSSYKSYSDGLNIRW